MKRKIKVGILLCLMLIIITGCSISTENRKTEAKEELSVKNYKLKEIKLDCDLENITFVNSYSLISNNKIYLYSNKKNSDTDSKCKIAMDDAEYNYIGKVYYANIRKPEVFTTNGSDIYYFDTSGEVTKLTDSADLINNYFEILEQYKLNDFYYYDNGFYVSDKEINYKTNGNSTILSIPENEKVLYATSFISAKGQFVITDKNAYTFKIDKKDKCNEYEDIKCTYELVKTDLFESLLRDFNDNISFFDGKYLATKDNKLYTVNFIN